MIKKKSQGDILVDQFATLLKRMSTESNNETVCTVGMSMVDKDLRQISNALMRQEKSIRIVDLKDNHITSP